MFMYLNWPGENWIIRKGLEAAGISFYEVTGEFKPAQRAKILDEFRDSDDTFVCLLSNVGLVGLNLAFANIMIIVDNLWSAQDYDQLVGRVWRHGQQKNVTNYHILALHTSDIFFTTVAEDKGFMHQVLAHGVPTIRMCFCGPSLLAWHSHIPNPSGCNRRCGARAGRRVRLRGALVRETACGTLGGPVRTGQR